MLMRNAFKSNPLIFRTVWASSHLKLPRQQTYLSDCHLKRIAYL